MAVSLDRYAEIRAEMEAGARRDEVLARLGISVDEWMAAQRAWLEGMGAEVARGRFDLSQRYAQAFLERQRALTAPSAPAAEAQSASSAEAALPAAPRPIEAKPTFLAAGAAAELAAPRMPVVKRPNPLLSGTMGVDSSAIRAALPFDPKAQPTQATQAPATTPAALPAVKRAPAALSGTSMAFVAPKGPALPFASKEPNASPPEAPPAPAPAAMPAVKRAPAALSGTSMAIVVPKGPALPFSQESPAPTPAPAPEAAPIALSLEQYASLCVELGSAPASAPEIFKRYGLTQEQAEAVDAHWKKRVSEDPAARAAFDRAYQAYQAWLLAARGGTPSK
jgi:hypothetical protein